MGDVHRLDGTALHCIAASFEMVVRFFFNAAFSFIRFGREQVKSTRGPRLNPLPEGEEGMAAQRRR
jgi:hypothetical protein